ncbi:N-acyl homoserine lactonase family protein [Salinisphaera hydrothermalis]|uniref:Putative AHL-lactonase n=1 Tax=Salinisphaera hydrothermalis (strain C41B8) TaxID=1304275 RepID=A0A084IRA7_SALHC|nr:N-acyl homoserine lactonase family protein [Salinisphaera hydrothermalis]KEZ79241.1 putative AHL-lactonase [Salinisphaera hydrothermalis C41B8]
MSGALRIRPLLTATHRYEKTVSTRGRGHGVYIEAPILAYLIETRNGRILFDVGCDYHKIATPELRARYLEPMRPTFDVPEMSQTQRIPEYLQRLGLTVDDIDLVFLSHLHFDHAGGLCDVPGCEVHIHRDEVEAADTGEVSGIFDDEIAERDNWRIQPAAYSPAPGIQAIETPGHTAGHMSLFIELPKGPPVILCGDAADLMENLDDEIAPGYCWQDRETQAVDSIRRLKQLAAQEGAELWPNHDFDFYRTLPAFPGFRE